MAKPGQFTVQQVVEREEWTGDKGQMVTYTLLFADDADKYKAHVPLDKDPGLEDNGVVEGWKNPGGKFGIATGSSNGAQRSPGGSSGDEPGRFDRKPEHPTNEARMKHTSALSAAPTYIEQMLTIGVIPQPKDKDDYVKTAEGVMTWLESTYPPAGE